MDEAVAALEQVALAIRDRVTDAFERASGVPLRARLEFVAEAVRHGEPGVGLEILCSNLDDFDVPLRASEYDQVEMAGRAMQLPADNWTVLAQQVIPDPD